MQELEKLKFKKYLFLLIFISFVIRSLIASVIELGNDEVSYWVYALFPGLSHFDHPPMVGYLIRIFTFNMFFHNEFFVRLVSIVFGTINTYLIYLIGKEIKDGFAGFYCALLYTASVYCFVITGIFILPDTPLLLFWLLAIFFFIKSLPNNKPAKKEKMYIMLAGTFVGLGMLSKYTAVFLWFGVIIYIIFFNRSWLKKKEFYFSIALSIVIFIPVIIWNIQNHFISFTFQGERVIGKSGIRLDYFATELLGQIFYNNPVNYFIILFSLIYFFRKKPYIEKNYSRLLILWSLPIIFFFLLSSLFRQTLPHWSAPGYLGLIILTGIVLRTKYETINFHKLFPKVITISLILLFTVITFGTIQIHYGIFTPQNNNKDITKLGEDDFSLDMYGWEQLGIKFSEISARDLRNGVMPETAPIITFRWFPAAHYDFYVANNINKKVYAIAELNSIRNYGWVNLERGNLQKGVDAYYIVSSRDYKPPETAFNNLFSRIEPSDTIRIYRNNKIVMNYFVFRMKGLKETIDFKSFLK